MTIQELQDYIDSKPDVRQLINAIADFMQANPGSGGGGFPVQLTADTKVDLNDHVLVFGEGVTNDNTHIFVDPVSKITELLAFDAAGDGSSAKMQVSAGSALIDFTNELNYNDNEAYVRIQGQADAISGRLEYTADTHTFNGKIINLDIVAKNFTDDAAAAAGGVEVGEDYHNAGIKRVRIA